MGYGKIKPMPDVEYLRSVLDYNKETGIFTWKRRGDAVNPSPTDRAFNARYEGTRAGHVVTRNHRQISLAGGDYLESRLAIKMVLGREPIELVVHKNGNSLDNRFDNLFEVSYSDRGKRVGQLLRDRIAELEAKLKEKEEKNV